MIKAIETNYNGYRFRSRLEARWAVFFDYIGVRYQYESEGFDIDGVRYLPDFYLVDYYIWFEVKGPHTTIEDLGKSMLFAEAGNAIIVSIGDVWYDASSYMFGMCIDDVETKIAPCPSCGGIGALHWNGYVCLKCVQSIDVNEMRLNITWYNAYQAARQARFEHKAH